MSDIEKTEEEIQKEKEAEKRQASMGLFYEERLPELEPDSFHEGFTLRTALGALFVAIIMLPGSMYLGLMMGSDLGPAAEWTTIILFVEVARRSFTVLKRSEIYVIYYLAGTVAAGGGAFGGLIWNQYLRQSPAAKNFGIAQSDKPHMMIPDWVVPPLNSPALIQRTFLHRDWLIPIAVVVIGNILGRMQWIGLGYWLFRATSDVERLPFPLAPVAAQGATALAEVSEDKATWRWPVFSTGTIIGLIYGLPYLAIPVLSGAFMLAPLQLIPIPFIDLTTNAEGLFPTGRIGLGTDLGAILSGFIIPYPIVVGGFISAMFSNLIFSPTLYRMGIPSNPDLPNRFFPTWRPGMGLIQTGISTGFDFWMSIGAGTAFAIAIIGMWHIAKNLLKARKTGAGGLEIKPKMRFDLPPGRGDFSIALALGLWFLSTLGFTLMCRIMVPTFPFWIVLFFGFIWSPLNSYVSARLIGMTGRGVGIPYLSQAAFILSGYKGVDIWYAPVPLYDQGGAAQRFREIELTGTKFTSIIKAEFFGLGIVLIFSFLYWQFYWKLSAIPSSAYPYAQTYWPQYAFNQCLFNTGTLPGGANYLLKAIKFDLIGYAAAGSLALSVLLSALGVHYMWFYGLIGGFASDITGSFALLTGALVGRYYMMKRFGVRKWQLYTPVLLAGYACGLGLIGMFSIALAIIFKAVRVLPY